MAMPRRNRDWPPPRWPGWADPWNPPLSEKGRARVDAALADPAAIHAADTLARFALCRMGNFDRQPSTWRRTTANREYPRKAS